MFFFKLAILFCVIFEKKHQSLYIFIDDQHIMKNWKQILINIYTPDIGSIWAAPNGIWDNNFAHNKPKKDYHPAIIAHVSYCKTAIKILPGTSKDYNKGCCVFKIKLEPNRDSHFLFKLAMTISSDNISDLKRGWNSIEKLDDNQLSEFEQKIKSCII